MSKEEQSNLVVASESSLDLKLSDGFELNESLLEKKAQEYANQLTNFENDSKEKHQNSVETIGRDIQLESSNRLKLLKQPLKKMADSGDDGGMVAKSLINLKLEVEKLDPQKFNFDAGWFTKLLGIIPGVGTPMKRYFSQFESAQTVIEAIINSLNSGRDELKRDNITLSEDQKFLVESSKKLQKMVKLSQLLDNKLVYKAEREFSENPQEKVFIEEKLLFPLRQRIMDFQQQLAVVQQGIISIEIIQRNNKELIRGVDRSLNVTVNALQVAATVAIALNNQKIVMDKITSINKTTDELIAGTAKRVKTQGVEIQKQAASAQLDLNNLKLAFADISTALDDISQFRQKALPEMAKTILHMDELSLNLDGKISEMTKQKELEGSIDISIEE
ncbi:MAG: toxic anion resistance protein [Bacteriovoracaceae bacterium]|nr:toxic anion resistance protein [Bacteriovoracaceae bacterium]